MAKFQNSDSYNTRQKELLLDFLETHKDQDFTIGEICHGLEEYHIGNSTIYRLINSLVKQGLLRCFADRQNRILHYQYLDIHCHDHLHLKCADCGSITHMDPMESDSFVKGIYDEYGFNIDVRDTFFYGICEDCAEKKHKDLEDKK